MKKYIHDYKIYLLNNPFIDFDKYPGGDVGGDEGGDNADDDTTKSYAWVPNSRIINPVRPSFD